ncbi:MAG: helix-turn-helix domain-containing protein [Actinomycetia bacterium]|nr:helix-turn-helix domain-containing protein [Actinomycetes bacterium]
MGIDWRTVGDRIRRAREAVGWDQGDLARAAQVSNSTVSRDENGDRPISADRLHKYGRLLHRDIKWFLFGDLPDPSVARAAVADAVERAVSDILPVKPIPILGTIPAGRPVDAEENREGTAWITPDVPGDFALRVRGDSMVGAGIQDGDLVVCQKVEAWQAVPPGRIVAALVGGEVTVKFLVVDPNPLGGDRWLLRAANPAYPDVVIDPSQDRIQGVVVQVQRVQLPTTPPPPPETRPAAEDLLAGLTPEQRRSVLVLIESYRRANSRSSGS